MCPLDAETFYIISSRFWDSRALYVSCCIIALCKHYLALGYMPVTTPAMIVDQASIAPDALHTTEICMETNYIYVAIYVATHVWRPILMKSV
jgi:hypothetical protein